MQKIIILRGAPASGKTTIARSFRNFDEKVAWLKVDNFKDFFAEDSSKALEYVNGSAIATLQYLLKESFSVVMDGIFQNTEAISKAIEVANNNQIQVKVFELEVSLSTLQERDKIREGVKEGFRKPLGYETIERIYNIVKENPYQNAIKLNTENNSLDECKKIIEEYFKES